MASIIQQIMQDEGGVGKFLEQLKNLTGRLDVETMRFDYGDGCEKDWNDVAQQLSGTIFDLVEHFGVDMSNWPAWFMFELAQWIQNEWGDTEQWLRDIHALAYLFSYGNTGFVDIDTPIYLLLASNVLCTAQEGWMVCLCDEPWTILTEVRRAIDDHYYGNYEHVLTELAEGRYDLRPVAETPPPPLAVSGPQSQVVQRKGAYTPAWSAPTVCVQPAADFPNRDQIAADVKKLLDAAEKAYTVESKVRNVVAIYKHLSQVVPDFVRAHPYLRITSLLKLIEFDDMGDSYKFNWVSGSPSYVELCDRALAAWSNTGISVPRGYRVVAFSCLRADATLGGLGSATPTVRATEKAARISMAVHLDQLEAHMVAFAPTLVELTRNGRRLRSGALLSAEPITLPNHVVPSVTHEVVVLVAPTTPPSSPPLPVLLDDDGGDGPTDPRSLVVYDDDYLDIEYAALGAPAPSNPPSPRPEDFEEINYDSDSDGDVFDDCDSEDGWERVHAYHRDRMLGLID